MMENQFIFMKVTRSYKNSFQVKNISLIELKEYLQDVGLYDPRYPLRAGRDQRTFYISGPPIYIKLVKAAAEFLDTDVQEKLMKI